MLERGDWIVLGCIVEQPCEGVLPVDGDDDTLTVLHCECCHSHGSRFEVDSLWGIIVENSTEAWEKFITDGGM